MRGAGCGVVRCVVLGAGCVGAGGITEGTSSSVQGGRGELDGASSASAGSAGVGIFQYPAYISSRLTPGPWAVAFTVCSPTLHLWAVAFTCGPWHPCPIPQNGVGPLQTLQRSVLSIYARRPSPALLCVSPCMPNQCCRLADTCSSHCAGAFC